MRFLLFIVTLAVVLGSVTVFYLNRLERNRPPEPAPPSRADTLKPLIEKGDARALTALGEMYRTGSGGVEQSFAAALRLFDAAARKGHPPAQYAMGRAYERGEGVRADPHRAAKWYEPAAKIGRDRNAWYALGRMAEKGVGMPHDPPRALEFYMHAATLGHPVAQYMVAIAYEQGFDGQPDLIEAYRWYLLAAERPEAVRAANDYYDAPGAVARLAAKMNRSQREEAEKRARRTRAGFTR